MQVLQTDKTKNPKIDFYSQQNLKFAGRMLHRQQELALNPKQQQNVANETYSPPDILTSTLTFLNLSNI